MSLSINEMDGKRSTISKTPPTQQLTHQIKDKIISFLKEEVLPLWLQSLKGFDVFYCLNIDSNSIHLAKVETKNGKLCNIISITEPIHENTSDEIENLSLALTSLLSKIKYRGEEISVNLSSDCDILNKIIEVELAESKSVQEWIIANRQKIFPPVDEEEIVFDYFLLGEEDKKKYLYLSICRREKINRLLEVFEKIHLNLKDFTTGGIQLLHFLKDKNVLKENNKLMAVLFQEVSAEVTLYENSKPIYIAQIPLNFQSVKSQNDEELFQNETDELINSLKRAADFYYKKDQATKDLKILLVGEEKLTQKLSDILKRTGMDLVDHSDLFKLSASVSNKSVSPSELVASSYVLAKTDQASNINFLPSTGFGSFLNPKPLQKAFNYGLKIFVSFLLIFGLLNLGFLVYETGNKEKLERFESKMGILNDLTERNKILTDKFESVQSIQVNRSRTSQLLFTLTEIMPEQIWLRDVTVQESGESSLPFSSKIEIAGLSTSEKSVTELLSNLEKSESFAKVQIEFLDKVPSEKIAKIPREYRKSIFRFKMNFISGL
jgi:Tfp pilus assembly PilM family ATPase